MGWQEQTGGHVKGSITEHTGLHYRTLYVSSNIRAAQWLELSIYDRYGIRQNVYCWTYGMHFLGFWNSLHHPSVRKRHQKSTKNPSGKWKFIKERSRNKTENQEPLTHLSPFPPLLCPHLCNSPSPPPPLLRSLTDAEVPSQKRCFPQTEWNLAVCVHWSFSFRFERMEIALNGGYHGWVGQLNNIIVYSSKNIHPIPSSKEKQIWIFHLVTKPMILLPLEEKPIQL